MKFIFSFLLRLGLRLSLGLLLLVGLGIVVAGGSSTRMQLPPRP